MSYSSRLAVHLDEPWAGVGLAPPAYDDSARCPSCGTWDECYCGLAPTVASVDEMPPSACVPLLPFGVTWERVSAAVGREVTL